MEIILSRLQDEQENKERFEKRASKSLENWAKRQPGGDILDVEIRVLVEETSSIRLLAQDDQEFDRIKQLRIFFNDSSSTQALFLVKKKLFMRSLVEISGKSVADLVVQAGIAREMMLPQLQKELSCHAIQEVRRALHNFWCGCSCGCRKNKL